MTTTTIIDKIKSVMLGHAVGDALGVPAEFCTREELDEAPVTTMEGFGTYPFPAGTWSDDTSMALAGLSERERYVLERRCGYRGDPVSQTQIAAELNISRARVGQIENNAIRKMRVSYQRIKMLQEYLPTVLSCENDTFYSRLLIKLFRLKPEHISYILNQ